MISKMQTRSSVFKVFVDNEIRDSLKHRKVHMTENYSLMLDPCYSSLNKQFKFNYSSLIQLIRVINETMTTAIRLYGDENKGKRSLKHKLEMTKHLKAIQARKVKQMLLEECTDIEDSIVKKKKDEEDILSENPTLDNTKKAELLSVKDVDKKLDEILSKKMRLYKISQQQKSRRLDSESETNGDAENSLLLDHKEYFEMKRRKFFSTANDSSQSNILKENYNLGKHNIPSDSDFRIESLLDNRKVIESTKVISKINSLNKFEVNSDIRASRSFKDSNKVFAWSIKPVFLLKKRANSTVRKRPERNSGDDAGGNAVNFSKLTQSVTLSAIKPCKDRNENSRKSIIMKLRNSQKKESHLNSYEPSELDTPVQNKRVIFKPTLTKR